MPTNRAARRHPTPLPVAATDEAPATAPLSLTREQLERSYAGMIEDRNIWMDRAHKAGWKPGASNINHDPRPGDPPCLSPDELAIFQRARGQLQQIEQAYGEAQRRLMDLGAHFIERYGLDPTAAYTIADDGSIVAAATASEGSE